MNIKHVIAAIIMVLPIAMIAQTIKGNKKIVTETRQQNALFTTINCDKIGEIIIAQPSAENKVVVEADENLLPYIKTEWIGKELKIYTKYSLQSTRCKITIYSRQLDNIKMQNCGIIKSLGDSLFFGHLKINLNAIGTINMRFRCTQLQIIANSVGDITLKGSAEKADLNFNSMGTADLLEFAINDLVVNLSSLAMAKLHAVKNISIQATSMAKLVIKGNPHFLKKEIEDYISVDNMEK